MAAAGRRTVSPEQAEIGRMKSELSRLKMGYRQSMSGTGYCFDNAPMESRSHSEHSLKVEETHGRGFETRKVARRGVFGYIEGFYNTTRMHSSINGQSPREFRRAFEAKRIDATTPVNATIDNNTIFNL